MNFFIKKCFLFFLSSGVFVCQNLYAVPAQDFERVALLSVYDADTFKVSLDCPYPIFCQKINVRVEGIDAPELKSKDPCEKLAAKKAKSFARSFLRQGDIVLRRCQRDKYFRILCSVFVKIGTEEESLSKALLAQGFAVPYSGGRKEKINWCEKE